MLYADLAARIVLHDWNEGKIKYYITPPTTALPTAGAGGEVTLMTESSSEFDVDGLGQEDIRVLDMIEAAAASNEEVTGAFVPITEIHFGDREVSVQQSTGDRMVEQETDGEGKTGIVKLSKKAIAAASRQANGERNNGRPNSSDTMSEARSIAGSITNTSFGGVLSRKQATTNSGESEPVKVDARKKQKLDKKKAIKSGRREKGEEPVEEKANSTDDNYDFSSDFTY